MKAALKNPNFLALIVLASLALIAVLTSCTGPRVVTQQGGTRYVQAVNEPITVPISRTTYDTIEVLKSDGIAGILILPNGTDTVKIKGGTRTFKGYMSGFVAVPMSGIGLGYMDAMRIDSTSIMIKKGGLILTPVK